MPVPIEPQDSGLQLVRGPPTPARGGAPDSFHREEASQDVSAACRVVETFETWTCMMSMPGFKQEDVSAYVANSRLTLSGKMQVIQETKDQKGNLVQSDSCTRTFSETFDMPRNTSQEQPRISVDAKGLITITVSLTYLEPEANTVKRPRSRQVSRAAYGTADAVPVLRRGSAADFAAPAPVAVAGRPKGLPSPVQQPPTPPAVQESKDSTGPGWWSKLVPGH